MKHFLGTVEVYRGGRYSVRPFLFRAERMPSIKLWNAARKLYGFPDEVNPEAKIAYFEDWETSVRPDRWKEVSKETYEEIKHIIQEVE